MEGLEISIIKYSKAFSTTGSSRWDSEYFLKQYVQIEQKLSRLETKSLQELSNFVKKGIFDLSPDNYLTDGVPLIRTSEIKNPLMSFSSTVFISNEINVINKKTILVPSDLVFTKIGAYIGDVSLLPKEFPLYNFSQNVAGVSLKDKKDGPYLLSFFLSKWGRQQILRSMMLSGQGKLELEDIRHYCIPIASKTLNDKILDIFERIAICNTSSKEKYSQAQEVLQSALSLSPYTPIIPTTVKKSLRESFIKTGRIDAEYYQPKYDFLFAELQKFECKKMYELVNMNKSIEPGSDEYGDSGIPFVRVSDYSEYGITTPSIYLDQHKFANTIRPQKDTILLSKDGSVGIAYQVRKNLDVITSGAILHLNIINNDILPEYLTLVLNSSIVKQQAERDAGGSIIQHWKPSEIEQVVIPILPMPIQQQIADLIRESFALRDEANQLLADARQLVEDSIENA